MTAGYAPVTDDELAAELETVLLAAPRIAPHQRPAIRAQVYLDRVADEGIDEGAKALDGRLATIMKAIESSGSYDEVAKNLKALDNGSPEFRAIVEGAVELALAAGVWAVNQEVDTE